MSSGGTGDAPATALEVGMWRRGGPSDERLQMGIQAAIAATSEMAARLGAVTIARTLLVFKERNRLGLAKRLLEDLVDYWPLRGLGNAAREREVLQAWLDVEFGRWASAAERLQATAAEPDLDESYALIMRTCADQMRAVITWWRDGNMHMNLALPTALTLMIRVYFLMTDVYTPMLATRANGMIGMLFIVKDAITCWQLHWMLRNTPEFAEGFYAGPANTIDRLFALDMQALERPPTTEFVRALGARGPLIDALTIAVQEGRAADVVDLARQLDALAGLPPRDNV